MNLIALLIPSFENILHSALFFRGHGGQNIFALSFRNSCGSSGKKFFFFSFSIVDTVNYAYVCYGCQQTQDWTCRTILNTEDYVFKNSL